MWVRGSGNGNSGDEGVWGGSLLSGNLTLLMWSLGRARGGIGAWSGEEEGVGKRVGSKLHPAGPSFSLWGVSEVSSKWWPIWVPYYGFKGHKIHSMLENGDLLIYRNKKTMVWCHKDLFIFSLSFVLLFAMLATFSLGLSLPLWMQVVASLFLGWGLAEKSNGICPSTLRQSLDIYLDWWSDSCWSYAHSQTNHCHQRMSNLDQA